MGAEPGEWSRFDVNYEFRLMSLATWGEGWTMTKKNNGQIN